MVRVWLCRQSLKLARSECRRQPVSHTMDSLNWYYVERDIQLAQLPFDGAIPGKAEKSWLCASASCKICFWSLRLFWPRPWKQRLSQQLQQYFEHSDMTMIITMMSPQTTATTMPIALKEHLWASSSWLNYSRWIQIEVDVGVKVDLGWLNFQ